MKKYSTIFLDLDDTILDFTASQEIAFDITFREMKIASAEKIFPTYKEINKTLWTQYEKGETTKEVVLVQRWRHIFDAFDLNHDPHHVNKIFLHNLAQRSDILEGALEFCKELAQDHELIIVTNGEATTQKRRIAAAGIADTITHVVNSEEVGYAKPHPKMFEAALMKSRASEKSEVLMIGDNYFADIVGARKFGMDACWFNPAGNANSSDIAPTFTVKNYSEIWECV